MPVITTYNPLGEGLDAAASAIQGGNDARDKALVLARSREQELYSRSEDAKRDKMTQDEFDERKDEFGQSHALDVQRTEADISHTQHQDKISDAVEATRAAMAPLLFRAQQLQLKVTAGTINETARRTEGIAIANETAKAQLALSKQFGPAMAQMALAQAEANYASTQQSTAFGALEEPGRVLGQNLQNRSTAISNTYGDIQNRYAPATFQLSQDQARATLDATRTGTTDKVADAEYRTRMTAYNRANADFQNKIAKGTIKSSGTDADGNPIYKDRSGATVPVPPEPLSSSDFTATISDTLEAITNPSLRKDAADKTLTPEEYANKEIQAINRTTSMSAAQQRRAVLAIKAVMHRMKSGGLMTPPSAGRGGGSLNLGGSDAAAPFLSSLGL